MEKECLREDNRVFEVEPLPEEYVRYPYSEEAEQAVLGSIFKNPTVFDDVCELVSANEFFMPNHRAIFSVIVSLAGSSQAIDVITVRDRWGSEGDLAYLTELMLGTASTANVKAYAQVVRNKALERGLLEASNTIVQTVYGEGTAAEKLNHAQSLVIAMTPASTGGPISAKEGLPAVIDNLDERYKKKGKVLGVKTGFTKLDKRYNGLRPSDLIIIAGRPSMGKTTLAMNIAEQNAVREGLSTLLFSLEMSVDQLLERSLASVGNIPFQYIRDASVLDNEYNSYLMTAAKRLADAPLYIDDSAALHINTLRARARKVHQKTPLSLIIVDYLQLMQGDGENRTLEITKISGGLKALAKELKVPVIAVSQLNRALETRPNKRPTMADLRDSGAIEQDADIIAFIYRDEVYNENTQYKGLAEIITRKFRNGAPGTDVVAAKLDRCRFENQIFGSVPQLVPVTNGYQYD